MLINVVLTQPMKASDQTITLSAGPLSLETEILIPADADQDEQECVSVCGVLSKSQAKVIRGARSTVARAWPTGTVVTLSSDGLMYERAQAPAVEPPPLELPTVSRRQPLDIAQTTKRGACPMCGRTD